MATISDVCPSCGAAISVNVGQRVFQDQLVWSQGYQCGNCGEASEGNGHGESRTLMEACTIESVCNKANGNTVSVVRILGQPMELEVDFSRELSRLVRMPWIISECPGYNFAILNIMRDCALGRRSSFPQVVVPVESEWLTPTFPFKLLHDGDYPEPALYDAQIVDIMNRGSQTEPIRALVAARVDDSESYAIEVSLSEGCTPIYRMLGDVAVSEIPQEKRRRIEATILAELNRSREIRNAGCL